VKKKSFIGLAVVLGLAVLSPAFGTEEYLLITQEGEYEREIDLAQLKPGESLIRVSGEGGMYVYPWQGENPLDYRADEKALWIGDQMVGVNLELLDPGDVAELDKIVTARTSAFNMQKLGLLPNLVAVQVEGNLSDPELDFQVFPKMKNLQGLYLDAGGELTEAQVAAIVSCTRLRELDMGACILPENAINEINRLANLRSLDVAAVPDEEIFALAGHKSLRAISRMWMVVDTGWVDFLKSLPNLTQLTVIQAEIANPVLAYLASSNRLEALSLPYAGIYGDKVAYIGKMTNLKELDLDGTEVEDSQLVHLANLTNLHTLYLGTIYLTDKGVEHIAGLTNLRKLSMGPENANQALKHLAGLTNLRELSLYGSDVTDEGLKHLAALGNLRRLDLVSRDITDEGLEHLKALHNLRYVDVSGTGVTDEGMREFKKALPECRVVKIY
jgi:internalin A